MEKCRRLSQLRSSQEQKQNNKGSSIILVITVIAIVSIFAVVLMTTSLMNYQMKKVNLHSQKNFYDAETIMDEIRSGLGDDLSDAVGEAYRATLSNYGNMDEAQRTQLYTQTFNDALKDKMEVEESTGKYFYSVGHLKNMVSDKPSGTTVTIVSADSSDLTSFGKDPSQKGILNSDEANGVFVIKNLSVSYVDQQDYKTEIQTDIVLTCPPIDYSQIGSTPDLLSYCLVADDYAQSGTAGILNMDGSAYLGMNGANFVTTRVNFTPSNDGSRLISGGTVQLSSGADLKTTGEYTKFWAHDLDVKNSGTQGTSLQGEVYLADDLVLETGADVTLDGKVYAFGNLTSAKSSLVYTSGNDEKFKDSCDNDPASNSSAFLINGKNVTLDMAAVNTLMIAGNSYVGASKVEEENTNWFSGTHKNSDIKMGESIALKSDQRAYLVPAEFIGVGCVSGGRNPMSQTTYNDLCNELVDKYDTLTDPNDIGVNYFVVPDGEAVGTLPKDLVDEYHVTGVKRQVYRVKTAKSAYSSLNMVYFFLEFENSYYAEKFGDSYFNQKEHLDKLKYQIDDEHYNTDITYPSSYTFYYNGSVLVPDGENTKFIAGNCTESNPDGEYSLLRRQKSYQESYAGLSHKLTERYASLADTEKKNGVYDNLVLPMVSSDTNFNITSGDNKVFADGENAAIVVNGDYTLSSVSATDMEGHTGTLHVVIASGDVVVNTDFEGLIFAGGTVTFGSGATSLSLKANETLAAKALAITDSNHVYAAQYLVNGDVYIGGSPSSSSFTGTDTVRYGDFITYDKWTKK